jgi:ABC-2 type transport system permease protein
MKRFRSPKTVVRRFVAKRTSRSAFILGAVLGLYMITKASSYLKAYPTEAGRQKIAESLGTNVGIEALLGVAHHIETVAGYVTWNFLCLIAAGGAVWALLIATKTLRGEEDSGRWELLLAGQTTARRATANALAGLGSGLVIIYILIALSLLGIGRLHGVNFTVNASLFFALALIAGAAEFLAVGALASQLMPLRSRAAGLSASVFGVFYMLRLIADTTNAHWLLVVSPLGWIEKLQPMYNSQPLWLLPIGAFVLVLSALSVFLAGRRDLGEGIFANKDTAKPRTRLLGTPFRFAIRSTRPMTLGWLTAIVLAAFVYGQLAKGAVVKALGQSAAAEHALSRLAGTSRAQAVSSSAFLGIAFFLIMVLAMFYTASAVGRMREDEAKGYLDNFLVRSVSRIQWLWGRVLLVVTAIILAGILSSLATWAGQASQHAGVSFHTLLLAGVNAMTPALLILGISLFAFGVAPRLTSALTYGAIAWSFLIVMLSSGLNLNHWLLDTSILHHVAFAPAVSSNWTADGTLVVIGLALCLAGALRFNSRDLQGE